MKLTKKEVSDLAIEVREGNQDAFVRLEGVARPLLSALSIKFSRYHSTFEYDDFYSTAMISLYNACLSYSPQNPSFLDYAKIVITREFIRQIQYWNAEKRNIFKNGSVAMDTLVENGLEPSYVDDLDEEIDMEQFRESVSSIIDQRYNGDKARMLKAYLVAGEKVVDIAKSYDRDYHEVYSFLYRGIKKGSRRLQEA